MASSMAGLVASSFTSFDLVNVVTGVVLYTTCATADEILRANQNLRLRGFQARYVRQGTYEQPNLHAA